MDLLPAFYQWVTGQSTPTLHLAFSHAVLNLLHISLIPYIADDVISYFTLEMLSPSHSLNMCVCVCARARVIHLLTRTQIHTVIHLQWQTRGQCLTRTWRDAQLPHTYRQHTSMNILQFPVSLQPFLLASGNTPLSGREGRHLSFFLKVIRFNQSTLQQLATSSSSLASGILLYLVFLFLSQRLY